MQPDGPAVCSGDEEVVEDPQPEIDPQPTPTYDPDTEIVTTSTGQEPLKKFPIIPVAAGVGAVILLAAIAG